MKNSGGKDHQKNTENKNYQKTSEKNRQKIRGKIIKKLSHLNIEEKPSKN